MKDILFFDKMFTPKIITLVYWLMLLGSIFGGLGSMFDGYGFTIGKLFIGILYIVIGAIGARVWCEIIIVVFKINEVLQETRSK